MTALQLVLVQNLEDAPEALSLHRMFVQASHEASTIQNDSLFVAVWIKPALLIRSIVCLVCQASVIVQLIFYWLGRPQVDRLFLWPQTHVNKTNYNNYEMI